MCNEGASVSFRATPNGRAVVLTTLESKTVLTWTTELPISSYSAFPIHNCMRRTNASEQIVSFQCGVKRAAWVGNVCGPRLGLAGGRVGLTWWNVPSEAITDPPSHDECNRSAGDEAASAKGRRMTSQPQSCFKKQLNLG